MEKIELNISERNTLDFDVEIEGITNETVAVKFVMEKNGMEVGFDGVLNEGTVSIDIPILSGMMKPDTYASKMVFIVEGDKYFEPMHVMTELIQPVMITTSIKESSTKKKAAVTEEKKSGDITFSNIKVTSTKPIMERLEDALPELAKAKNMKSLLSVYNKDVLLKESSDTTAKAAIEFIDAFCKDRFGHTFKEYIKENK
jgi:hypothetical protein